MSITSIGRLEFTDTQSYPQTGLNLEKVEPEILKKLTQLVAKYLNKSHEAFLKKHHGSFDPQKKIPISLSRKNKNHPR